MLASGQRLNKEGKNWKKSLHFSKTVSNAHFVMENIAKQKLFKIEIKNSANTNIFCNTKNSAEIFFKLIEINFKKFQKICIEFWKIERQN